MRIRTFAARIWVVSLGLSAAVAVDACVIRVDDDDDACGVDVCSEQQCCIVSCGGVDPIDWCATPPEACTADYSPVCGCDGVTYGNACGALGACVAIDHAGPCEGTACGEQECNPGECCLAACGGVDVDDACLAPPEVCTDEYAPVCGCDGVTYGNACTAHAACVAIDHDGACDEPSCGGQSCGRDQCCIAGCGGVDPADICITPPDACPEIWAPVCGCDGTTYGTDCAAHSACVAVAYEGMCEVCDYADPTGAGCPRGTTECPGPGPALRCVPPDQFDACCCPECE